MSISIKAAKKHNVENHLLRMLFAYFTSAKSSLAENLINLSSWIYANAEKVFRFFFGLLNNFQAASITLNAILSKKDGNEDGTEVNFNLWWRVFQQESFSSELFMGEGVL